MKKNSAALCVLLCLFFIEINLSAQAASQWETEIRTFENSDLTNPPPQNAVLFIGSSSIRKWRSLAEDFSGVRVINRGFGGSEIHDSTEFANRIIFPYHPRIIVIYAGDNDLAAGKTPAQVAAEYTDFIATVHAKLPATRIVFISIKPSPLRWKLNDEIIETDRRIVAMKARWLAYVNIYSLTLDTDGNPQKDLFLSDGLHPSEKAYQLWAAQIRPFLN